MSTPQLKRETFAAVTPLSIMKFYVPLSAVFMTYAIVFNVMNSAMARSKNPALALAAFAVAQSIADVISVPAGSGNQWLLSRGRDKVSFRAGLRVMLQIAFAMTVVMAVTAFTPIGRLVYGTVFRAPAELHPDVRNMLIVCLPLPWIFVLRGSSQSILMLRRKTHLMTLGVFVRLAYVSFGAWAFGGFLDGTLLGAVLWISGMGVEGLANFIASRGLFAREYAAEPADPASLTPERIWKFLLPLIATSLLWSLGGPVLNSGMARTQDPKHSIAVFQLVSNAAWILLAFARDGLRQVMVVFWNDERSLRVVHQCAKCIALVISGLMVLLTVSGGAMWFLANVVGASKELLASAGSVLFLISFMPAALVFVEILVGRLLRHGVTGPISLAKGANITALAVTVFVLVALRPGAGPAIGAAASLMGVLAEAAVLYPKVRQLPLEPGD